MAANVRTIEESIADAVRAAVREELEPVRAELARFRAREEEEGVTEEDAARRLSVSVKTVQRWCRAGKLEGRKVGGARRVLLSSVLAHAGEPSNVRRLREP
jgi:excisionase family DNA binding protein